ncbi:MAG: C1 family peptidase [Chloroflexota bacterium]
MKKKILKIQSKLVLRFGAVLLLWSLLFVQSSVAFTAGTSTTGTSSTGTYTWGLGAKPAHTKPGGVAVAPKIFQENLTAAVGAPSTLPPKVDYTALVPPVGNQGSQGSCVGWAIGYYYKSIQEYRERRWSLTDPTHQFSPSFVYNQINNGYDYGAWPDDAFNLLQNTGTVSIADFPYNASDYRSQPSVALKAAASYKAKSWQYLFYNVSSWPYYVANPAGTVDMLRQYLAQGDVFALTIPIYDTWDYVGNSPTSVATKPTNLGSYRGYHEVTVIGYDDTIVSSDGLGAFRVVNSWGTSWGNNGFTWLSYDFLTQYGADASSMVNLYSVARSNPAGGAPNWSLTGSHWYQIPDNTSLSGIVSANFVPNEELSFPFYGTSITWVGPLNQVAGVADVYIDGTFQQRVDQWSSSVTTSRSVVYHRADLPPGNHTFRLVVKGPIIEHCPGNWSCTPRPVRGATMIDALLANAANVDDSVPPTPGLTYSSSVDWLSYLDIASYKTTETRSSAANANFTYTFNGTTVTWVGITGPDYGRANIFLDDTLVTAVELYSFTTNHNQVLFSEGGLAQGNHTLKVVVRPDHNALATNSYVGVDYLMVNNL